MKARAYVLVETAVGKTKTVVTALKKMDGVNSVDTVTGPYDVKKKSIMQILYYTTVLQYSNISIFYFIDEADTLNEVGDIITARIHTVDGISRTVTSLVV